MFDEFKERRFAAPPLLKRMVLAGWNGRKSGRGFYDYVDPQESEGDEVLKSRRTIMAYENLLYEKKDGIAYVTFNRPKVLNALNRKTVEELHHALLVRARRCRRSRVILTGAGEKSFVAGADIGELAQANARQRQGIFALRAERVSLAGNDG